MKVVYIKNNNFQTYRLNEYIGYKFKPRNKFVKSLELVNSSYIKNVLKIKIKKDINKATKAIRLMLKSNITEISDCNIMIKELKRIASILENKYMKYFNEFEYYEIVKDIYYLNMEITTKKKLIEENI